MPRRRRRKTRKQKDKLDRDKNIHDAIMALNEESNKSQPLRFTAIAKQHSIQKSTLQYYWNSLTLGDTEVCDRFTDIGKLLQRPTIRTIEGQQHKQSYLTDYQENKLVSIIIERAKNSKLLLSITLPT